VTAADLLVLAPWLIFGAALAAICYRLLARRCASHRHRRGGRWWVPPGRARAAAGCAIVARLAIDPLVNRDQPGCARDIHPSFIARTSPLRRGGLSREAGPDRQAAYHNEVIAMTAARGPARAASTT